MNEINYGTLFSYALSGADAEKQAAFFNDFYRSLKLNCKRLESNQLCYIADYLDENGREFFKEMAEHVKISLESRAKIEFDIQELYRKRRELEEEIRAINMKEINNQ